jgi:hypothetical protein
MLTELQPRQGHIAGRPREVSASSLRATRCPGGETPCKPPSPIPDRDAFLFFVAAQFGPLGSVRPMSERQHSANTMPLVQTIAASRLAKIGLTGTGLNMFPMNANHLGGGSMRELGYPSLGTL